jgi:hypothetical protein
MLSSLKCIAHKGDPVWEAVWEAVRGTETTETTGRRAWEALTHHYISLISVKIRKRWRWIERVGVSPISANLRRWQAMRGGRLGEDKPTPQQLTGFASRSIGA